MDIQQATQLLAGEDEAGKEQAAEWLSMNVEVAADAASELARRRRGAQGGAQDAHRPRPGLRRQPGGQAGDRDEAYQGNR